ncbi:hypothetical protein C8J56DRAFT_890533 [Mycena floridula]|nr:hypothetical protein C8J56DRAFT_890533 [Mycena floridula]
MVGLNKIQEAESRGFVLEYSSSSGMAGERNAWSCSSGDEEPVGRVYRPPLGVVQNQPILIESEDSWDKFENQSAPRVALSDTDVVMDVDPVPPLPRPPTLA